MKKEFVTLETTLEKLAQKEMNNSFNSVAEAEECFKTHKAWAIERLYFKNSSKSIAVCLDTNNVKEGYFIITHPICTKYREKLGQIIKYI